MIKKTIIWVVRFYQNFISPHLGKNCRFYPSCSEYCRQTIEKYGLTRGLRLSLVRIIKCHPWHQGGIDLP